MKIALRLMNRAHADYISQKEKNQSNHEGIGKESSNNNFAHSTVSPRCGLLFHRGRDSINARTRNA